MKLSELVKILDAKVYTNNFEPDKTVDYAFSCDLMSDALMILRSAPFEFCEQGLLATGLVTIQGVRTAEMLDIGILLLVRGKVPNETVIKAAEESNIIIISTKYTMFSANGKLYQSGIKGLSEL